MTPFVVAEAKIVVYHVAWPLWVRLLVLAGLILLVPAVTFIVLRLARPRHRTPPPPLPPPPVPPLSSR